MRKWKLALCLAFILVLVFSATSAHAQLPPMPHSFFGDVTIGGVPAPVATLISARVGGVERGYIVTTEVGKYGNLNPLLPKLVVQGQILEGSLIEFFINGVNANETYSFTGGATIELNLSRAITPTPPPAPISSLDDPGTWLLVASGIGVLALYWYIARWKNKRKRNRIG